MNKKKQVLHNICTEIIPIRTKAAAIFLLILFFVVVVIAGPVLSKHSNG